ncbi:MAG: DUF4133 domain-containing protein [Sphingobacterium sp.]
MANSIYTINKGINKPIEFKGLKAQYIWYLGGIIVILMIVYAVLYLIGIDQFVCLLLIGLSGAVLFTQIFKLSKKYGQHGLMKAMAKRMVPVVIKCNNRKVFMKRKMN